MNLKRWFAWLCLALMVVAELLLFRANHEKDALLINLQTAQHDNRQLAAELDELKNSNTGLQASEILRLRKQNEILTNQLVTLQADNDRLRAESQQNAQHLTTARTALELQQEHLAQLQSENQEIAAAHAATLQRTACVNNLRQIDAAKQQWALEKNKTDAAVPTAQDLLPYLPGGNFPVCPAGGVYTINAVGELPSCSVTGHDLPAP
jgi:prolyl-tRNA editing enzyme YbaK/EbsC (Cys-tRNA(Pro) deacylase)